MKYITIADGIARVENEGGGLLLHDLQSALDLIGNAWAEGECTRLVLLKEDISEDFFDLKTRIAGEILQKFVNYGFRIAIVGEFTQYSSKSLKDFIYESNRGRAINFTDTLENAIAALS